MELRYEALAGSVLAAFTLAAPHAFGAESVGDSGPVAATAAATVTTFATVQVLGQRLDAARNALSPKTGTSQFTFDQRDIDQLPLGENTPLNHLMLQAPGVAQGDYGELHIRGEMTQPQYRINGTIVPDGISGFGQAFDLRIARRVEFVTGALPAQYNYRTNVINIETKQTLDNGGKVGLTGGSYGTFNPSFELSGSSDRFSYYLTGSFLRANNGVLLPTGDHDAVHDRTQQQKGFALVSFVPDAQSRWSLMAGTARSRFQIPNVRGLTPTYPLDGVSDLPNIASTDLNERQKELNRYAVLSYEGGNGSDLDYQAAFFNRYSKVQFTPDTIGDLVYRGVASSVTRQNRTNGLQVDASLRRSASHTLRAGLTYSQQRTDSANSSDVFPADDDGAQLPGAAFAVADARSIGARIGGLYLQDEWQASPRLIVNYGLRYDWLSGPTSDSQVSPRLNAVYKLAEGTSLHAGYARFFNPPRLELIGPDTVSKFVRTTNQPEVRQASPVVPERVHYLDAGVSHRPTPTITVGFDAYAKHADHMVDFGQFGQALVYSPFNWTRARVFGIELTAQYRKDDLSAYANAAVSRARAKGISSGEYNFGQEELDHINNHWVYMDHDQRWTSSAGAAYKWRGTTFTADAFFGSGMRSTPESGSPNSSHLPGYVQANVGAAREFQFASIGKIGLRLTIVNLFDRTYEIRDGTGVGVGAPQYGARRSFYGTLSAGF